MAYAFEVAKLEPAEQLNQSFVGIAHPHILACPVLIGVPI